MRVTEQKYVEKAANLDEVGDGQPIPVSRLPDYLASAPQGGSTIVDVINDKLDKGQNLADLSSTGQALTNLGLDQVDNTSDANKPVSTAQGTAIAVVSGGLATHIADHANPHAVTKAQVGLSNVDNTSDANKPVSTAQATAIAGARTGAVADVLGGAGLAYDTLAEIQALLTSDESTAAALATTVAGKLAKSQNLADLVDVAVAHVSLKFGAVNVKAKGAVGDWNGTTGTDDTAAIDNAITAALAPGGTRCVYFPRGRYKRTTPLLLDQVGQLTIFGDNSYETSIVQTTANVPGLKIITGTDGVAHSIVVSGLMFENSNAPTALTTQQVGLQVWAKADGTGSAAASLYRSIFNNLQFRNVYRGISDWVTSSECPVWGNVFSNITVWNCLDSEFSLDSAGPNNLVINLHGMYDGDFDKTLITGPAINVGRHAGITLIDVNFEDRNGKLLQIGGGTCATFINFRCERHTIDTHLTRVFYVANGVATFISPRLDFTLKHAADKYATVFYAGAGGTIDVSGADISRNPNSNGTVGLLAFAEGDGSTGFVQTKNVTLNDAASMVMVMPPGYGPGHLSWVPSEAEFKTFNVKAYGAKGDGRRGTDGTHTDGTTAFTSATAAFTSADEGKKFILATSPPVTITAVNSSTSITLSAPPLFGKSGYANGSAPWSVHTDDTAAINRTWAIAVSAGSNSISFPPGKYLYDGAGLDGTKFHVKGGGLQATEITLGRGRHLITHTGASISTDVGGFTTRGGAGLFKSTTTSGLGASGWSQVKFRDIHAKEYLGTYIGWAADDFPYFEVRGIVFDGGSYVTSVGLGISGYPDSSVVEYCVFNVNRHHVVVRGAPHCLSFEHCTFLRSGSQQTRDRTGIWVVPSTSETNTGGSVLKDCKFGNENMEPGDKHVLLADADSTLTGTLTDATSTVLTDTEKLWDVYLATPVGLTVTMTSGAANGQTRTISDYGRYTFTVSAPFSPAPSVGDAYRVNLDSENAVDPDLDSDSAGYVTGWTFQDVEFAGTGTAPNEPFLYAALDPTHFKRMRLDLSHVGTAPPYVVQFRTSSTTGRVTGDNILTVRCEADAVPLPFCNVPGLFNVEDSSGIADGDPGLPLSGPGGGRYTNVTDLRAGAAFTPAIGTATPITDAGGGTDAVTFNPATNDLLYILLTNASLRVGSPVWVEFDLKRSADSPATQVKVQVNGFSDTPLHFRRVVRVPSTADGWQPYRFGFTPNTTGANLLIGFQVADGTAGQKIDVGRVAVYHSREPQLPNTFTRPLTFTGRQTFTGVGSDLSYFGGPGRRILTSSDSRALWYELPYAHDNIQFAWDAEFDQVAGDWVSSTTSGNFRMAKIGGQWTIDYCSGVSPGGYVVWTNGVKLDVNGKLTVRNLNAANFPTYADNAAAVAGGLVVNDLYKTSTGEVRVRV